MTQQTTGRNRELEDAFNVFNRMSLQLESSYRDLEQQDVQRRADGRDGADADVIGQRELPDLGKAKVIGDDAAVEERHELVQHIGRDNGHGIVQGGGAGSLGRGARRRTRIMQCAPHGDDG